MRGAGFMDFLSKAHSFIKDNKLVSTIGNALGSMGVPYAGKIGSVGAALGYGRRRRRRGRGLRLSGGSMARPHFATRIR
jgi:hypothetical protein